MLFNYRNDSWGFDHISYQFNASEVISFMLEKLQFLWRAGFVSLWKRSINLRCRWTNQMNDGKQFGFQVQTPPTPNSHTQLSPLSPYTIDWRESFPWQCSSLTVKWKQKLFQMHPKCLYEREKKKHSAFWSEDGFRTAFRGDASGNQRAVKEWISKSIFHLKPGDALLTRRSVQRWLMCFNDKNEGWVLPSCHSV